jgi:hypothetical protein
MPVKCHKEIKDDFDIKLVMTVFTDAQMELRKWVMNGVKLRAILEKEDLVDKTPDCNLIL